MSVHPYKTADGTRYQVRWRESNGRVRTRSLTSKREAIAFDADVKARKFKGDTLPRRGRENLATAYDEWWRLHGSTLSKNTQEANQAVWRAHIKNRHDHYLLSELVADPQLIDEISADMRERGVGNAAQRRVLAVLSGVLTHAVRWNKIAVNPVLAANKPPKTRKRIPHPFPPIVIERIRLHMSRQQREGWPVVADYCLVELMSYAGLRPGEALALTWADVGTQTLSIDKAASVGEQAPTKTRGARVVPLVEQLAHDLKHLHIYQGEPPEDQLVLPARDGKHWSRSKYNNWRNRVWKPTMQTLSEGQPPQPRLATAVPYDCRGSFISLQLRAGASPVEVAAWAGHSPQVMFEHYTNVIEELVGEPVLSAADQIARARATVIALEKQELDELMAELIEHPTIAASAEKGAAVVLYQPGD